MRFSQLVTEIKAVIMNSEHTAGCGAAAAAGKHSYLHYAERHSSRFCNIRRPVRFIAIGSLTLIITSIPSICSYDGN